MQTTDQTNPPQTEARKKRKPRPSVAVGLWIIKRIERVLVRYSRVADTPVLDAGQFDWVKPLEADWRKVRAELEQILEKPEELPNFQDM